MTGLPLQVCNTLWIGGDLGPISTGCLSSFLRRGHQVILHCYDAPADAPPGVEIADATEVLPPSRIIRHKASGSYSLFSNLFRYELMRQRRGLWIDCDVYCVRPIADDREYVFGWQNMNSINGAVLRLPADSPALDRLVAIFDEPSPILPWLSTEENAPFVARKAAGTPFELGDLPWGVAGPRALTHVFNETGLSRYAQQRRVFYPVAYNDGPMLLRRGDLARSISGSTRTVHLWNEELRKYLDTREPGSPIDRLLSEGTLYDESRIAGS